MTPQLWIGVGFTAALLVFLFVTYFARDNSSSGQYNTLRFLTALCGGFAGGFLAGEALLSINREVAGGTNFALSGTAGFAVFFLIWLRYPPRQEPPLPTRVVLSIPAGWTFQQAVLGIGRVARINLSFSGFSEADLKRPLPATEIDEHSVESALRILRHRYDEFPPYRVERNGGLIQMMAEEGTHAS